MKRVHVFITGKVHGVFFRAFVKRNATKLGIDGWVKNTPEGRVEAIFEGPEEAIKQMLELCNKGPAGSTVKRVEYKEEPVKGESGFIIG